MISGKPKLEFRYRGMLRATIKFEKYESAESVLAKIKELQNELKSSNKIQQDN